MIPTYLAKPYIFAATVAAILAAIPCQAAQNFDRSGQPAPPVSSALLAPTSTLLLTSTTTAYSAGQLIASNSNGTLLTVPSFTIPQPPGQTAQAFVPRVRISINDATSTAWPTVGIQIDLWSAAPTFSAGNGDRSAFSPATGTGSHLGAYSCTTSPEYGDGVYAECAPLVGIAPAYVLPGSQIYWTAQATTASGTTGASKTMTLTAEIAE